MRHVWLQVEKMVDRYTARIRMLDSGDLLSLDQDDLETVVPSVGRRVRLVKGAWRGEEARQPEICA